MIVNPDQYIETFKSVGADVLTVHYEACTHLHRTLQAIKAAGMQRGVALNPHTPISVLEDVINDIDLVLPKPFFYSIHAKNSSEENDQVFVFYDNVSDIVLAIGSPVNSSTYQSCSIINTGQGNHPRYVPDSLNIMTS